MEIRALGRAWKHTMARDRIHGRVSAVNAPFGRLIYAADYAVNTAS